MKRRIGFAGSYWMGLMPSSTPAWGGAPPVSLVDAPPAIVLVPDV
jgi:hypothetical protein